MKLKEASKVNGHRNVPHGIGIPVKTEKSSNKGIGANRITAVNIPLSGLCINCNELADCHWKENHKIHCEHYH